jgi:UDP-glucose 4-epimerase
MYLITGAAGFIGSYLAKVLYDKGDKIILIDDYSYGHESNLFYKSVDLNKLVKKIDISKLDHLKTVFMENKITKIINFAGIAPLPDCQSNPTRSMEVNLLGVINLLECIREFGAELFIQASTNAVYEGTKNFPSTENMQLAPTLIYPTSKFFSEIVLENYFKMYKIPSVSLRFSNVYGPNMDFKRKHPPFIPYMLINLLKDNSPTYFGDGEQSRDYIFVNDLIDLILIIFNQGTLKYETINASSNESFSVSEIHKIANELLNKKIDNKFENPSFFWNKYNNLFNSKYPIDKTYIENEVKKYSNTSNLKAQNVFGWYPKTNFKDGLKIMIDYIINNCSQND